MATPIYCFAYGSNRVNIDYDPVWDSDIPSEPSLTKRVTVGPYVTVASFMTTLLKLYSRGRKSLNVTAHVMVVNDKFAFLASRAMKLGQVVHPSNNSGDVGLNVNFRLVNVKFNFDDIDSFEYNLDITQTFGDLKKQVMEQKRIDLNRYQVKYEGYVLTDDSPLASIRSPQNNTFNCTK